MKKIVLWAVAACCLILCLVACDDGHSHNFAAWTTTKNATCTESGQENRYCSCGLYQTREIPAGHTYHWTVSKEATCTDAGERTGACKTCGENKTEVINPNGHNWTNATCTEPQTCLVCHAVGASALGHTGTTGVCSRCNQTLGTWSVGDLVDEFQHVTGYKFIGTTVEGVFSNFATTNSELTARVSFALNNLAIELREYGYLAVKCTYGQDDYLITMLDTEGVRHNLSGFMTAGSSHLFFAPGDQPTVLNALKQPGEVSFYIVLSDRPTTTYTFTVKTTNFAVLYEQMITTDPESGSNPSDSPFSVGLEYESTDDGRIGVVGIGQCTDVDIVIPDVVDGKEVVLIADEAFKDCQNIKSVTFPDTLLAIGVNSFDGCTGFTSVIIPDSVIQIQDYAFANCSNLQTVIMGDGVLELYAGVFKNCTSLKQVTFGDSINIIGFSAFSGCTGLTQIVIPDTVTSIGMLAFYNCSALNSITLSQGITEIKSTTFSNCSGLTSITIPFGVSKIGIQSFENCTGLERITISNSVTKINNNAFSGCTNLNSIVFEGTKTEWNAVKKYQGWNDNTGWYTVYCKDGNVSK